MVILVAMTVTVCAIVGTWAHQMRERGLRRMAALGFGGVALGAVLIAIGKTGYATGVLGAVLLAGTVTLLAMVAGQAAYSSRP